MVHPVSYRSTGVEAAPARSTLIQPHPAAPGLDRAAAFLGIDAPRLGGTARLGGPPLDRALVRLGEQIDKPRPRIGAVGLLRAKTPRGDQEIARPGHPADRKSTRLKSSH